MAVFSAFDSACMARALRLAERGRFGAHPNPMVGCVLARSGVPIGEGWHARAGAAHAEIAALEAAGDARGATAYVTLEPCAHHGKTPPCAEALIAAGVAEVVIAMQDPFEAVSGRGTAALEAAGIGVRTGLMQADAAHLNRAFLKRVTTGRPFVRLKVAASLDGAVAMRDGASQWITGAEARADVQRLRAASGAILTGVGTVLADDPSLTVRADGIGERQPLRAVVDSRLRTPPSARMLSLAGTTLVFCLDGLDAGPLVDAGAEVVAVADKDGRVDLDAVLDELGRREVNDLLVEAGSTLAGALLEAGRVDELVIYLAPHIMGSETRGMFATPGMKALDDRRGLVITDSRRVGADIRITARPD
jgi:diaminohydroxyphosphoribosylaminopyrimidine deaminase/5-amino-6-(5-phosphoribosylamino)uracil reductase